MKTIDKLNSELLHTVGTQIRLSDNRIYWKDFCWGTIHTDTSTFQVVSRSERNVFGLFGRGLGINAEALYLLQELGITYIEIPFEAGLLKTTVTKWLARGITSPYASSKIDRQVILSIDQINMSDEPSKLIIPDNQLLLWGA